MSVYQVFEPYIFSKYSGDQNKLLVGFANGNDNIIKMTGISECMIVGKDAGYYDFKIPSQFIISEDKLDRGMYLFKLKAVKKDKKDKDFGIVTPILYLHPTEYMPREKKLLISALTTSERFIDFYTGDLGTSILYKINFYNIINHVKSSDHSVSKFVDEICHKKISIQDAINLITEPSPYENMAVNFLTAMHGGDPDNKMACLAQTFEDLEKKFKNNIPEWDNIDAVGEWLYNQDLQYDKLKLGDSTSIPDRIEDVRFYRFKEKQAAREERKKARKANKN